MTADNPARVVTFPEPARIERAMGEGIEQSMAMAPGTYVGVSWVESKGSKASLWMRLEDAMELRVGQHAVRYGPGEHVTPLDDPWGDDCIFMFFDEAQSAMIFTLLDHVEWAHKDLHQHLLATAREWEGTHGLS